MKFRYILSLCINNNILHGTLFHKILFTASNHLASNMANVSSATADEETEYSPKDDLENKIRLQGELVRQLKTQKADKDVVKEAVDKLIELKMENGEEFFNKRIIKTAKGTRDYGPKQMMIREKVLSVITNCFKRHGGETIDTPVFELRETLLGKYGDEGGKLIYDLMDQGGELLSLRYDLTDFDIAGQYDLMIPESECLRITFEILNQLDLGEFEIKVNHRRLLDGMFAVCGVPDTKFKTVCSTVDKLDKVSWDEVKFELINDKGLPVEVVNKLETYVCSRTSNSDRSSIDLIGVLSADTSLATNTAANEALNELRLLFNYCETLGLSGRVVFDPSLARGLDYYTGIIYEAMLKNLIVENDINVDATDEDTRSSCNVGSIAGGGRYDDLVGMFDPKHKKVPCIGVSIGIERIFTLIERKLELEDKTVRTNETQVFVASAQKKLLLERMKLARQLWDANINAEIAYKNNPRMLDQMQYCEAKGVPLAVIIGESEIQEGVVKVRDIATRIETKVPNERLIDELRSRLGVHT